MLHTSANILEGRHAGVLRAGECWALHAGGGWQVDCSGKRGFTLFLKQGQHIVLADSWEPREAIAKRADLEETEISGIESSSQHF